MKTIFIEGTKPWKYYLLLNAINNEFWKVTEEEFFDVVGYNRNIAPMHYDKKNKNKQNFYLDNQLIGYRERKKSNENNKSTKI